MDGNLIIGIVFILLGTGLSGFPFLIHASKMKSLVDIPSLRRRHETATPITGGIGINFILFLGLALYSLFNSLWFFTHITSILVMSAALFAISLIGFVDDIRGLSPKLKLLLETFVAISVLSLEPEIHGSLVGLCQELPFWASPIIWALAALWIVGSANALNLVDGIDGLAGASALLMLTTCLGFHYKAGGLQGFMPVLLVLAVPALISFLKNNWHPAKIFLGDNGSLSLGFLVACGAFVPMRAQDAVPTFISFGILMGLPILDMGLCVFRRRLKGYSIFKADRNHLHHRIQRLGLNTAQATTLLLFVCGYLQISAFLIQYAPKMLVALISASAVIALMMLLYFIRCIEHWRSDLILRRHQLSRLENISQNFQFDSGPMIKIDLAPLLEVGQKEESHDVDRLLSCLEVLLKRNLKGSEKVLISSHSIHIFLSEDSSEAYRATLESNLREQLKLFQQVFSIQYALGGLPMQMGGRKYDNRSKAIS